MDFILSIIFGITPIDESSYGQIDSLVLQESPSKCSSCMQWRKSITKIEKYEKNVNVNNIAKINYVRWD